MSWMTKARTAALAIGSAVALSGCGYGGYTNVGLGVGYADSGYYDPYYGGYGYGYGAGYGYDGFGYGYGYPGYGWYNDFYYPGTGFYVFDRGGRRYRWNDDQRRYWQNRGNYAGGPRDRGAWTRGQVTPPATAQGQGQGRWNGRPGGNRGAWSQGQATPQGQARPQAQAPSPAFRSAPQSFRAAPSGGGGGGGHGTWTQQGGGRRR